MKPLDELREALTWVEKRLRVYLTTRSDFHPYRQPWELRSVSRMFRDRCRKDMKYRRAIINCIRAIETQGSTT